MRVPRCLCSRCNLFLRASKNDNPDDYDSLLDGPAKSSYFEQREYQNALIDLAIKRNIIACLPTGSGKTFIAYKLVEHFQHDIASKGKKVFFLANTIPLVNQQAAFFARNLSLTVRHITGDMEVDYWSPEKWNLIVDECQILAMTSQIFLNIIRHAYIKWSQIALVIFDECHHAQSKHPMKEVSHNPQRKRKHAMKEIMLEYHMIKDKCADYDLPRILGLTATIIMGNCKPSEVPTRVKELENTMCATAVTYKDYEEVLRHSTSAVVQPIQINNSMMSSGNDTFISVLEEKGKELGELRKQRKLARMNALKIDGIHSSLQNSKNVYLCEKQPSPGDLRVAVDDVRRTYLDMGVYPAVIAINLRLAFIDFSLMDINDLTMKNWYKTIRALFEEFKVKLLYTMRHHEEEDRVTEFISPKLKKLISILLDNFGNLDAESDDESESSCECGDGDKSLCGLIFTDRRVSAQVLAWYLKDLASCNKDFGFLRTSFVVGTSRSPFETVESRIYAKKQTDTINGFRSKRFNLLTATSVLEEGIDVPSCNVVIRFDPISTYTSYVQSMGRARRKDALFYVFLDNSNFVILNREREKLSNFKLVNDAMVAHLIAQVKKVDDSWGNVYNFAGEHSIEPFCPGGTPDSPHISMESAFEIVQTYCMLLPNDGISTLQPISWWTEEGWSPLGRRLYQGHLKFPMNSTVKGRVSGLVMEKEELAKQSVFFEAAKKLYEEGALDDKLCPRRPSLPTKVEAFFKINDPLTEPGEEGEIDVGNEEDNSTANPPAMNLSPHFQRQWYQKLVPEIFQKQLILGKTYCVYRICLELTNRNANYKWQNLYDLEGKDFVGEFPLFGGFGRISVQLKKIPKFSVELKGGNFNTLRNFQHIIFRDILGVSHPLMEEADGLSFAIVPLEKHEGSWRVDKDMFPRDNGNPGINHLFTTSRLRPPHDEIRKQSGRGQRFAREPNYIAKYTDAVVCPWYKKDKKEPRPLYLVDNIESDLSPLSKFYDGNYSNYKNFYDKQYNTKVYNSSQPLLKCKLAGIGKGSKQLNYLLEKYAKEDEFPVYLIPELLFVLPLRASTIIQLKLLPSILHRLSRLLNAKGILDSVGTLCGWPGVLSPSADNSEFDAENIERMERSHTFNKMKEEERRKEREEKRKQLKRVHKPIVDKKHILDRELHYEFVHPNKILRKDVELFHEAVSGQHSAKKLILAGDVELEFNSEELFATSKIALLGFGDVLQIVPRLDGELDLKRNPGPSLICLVEAITRVKSNEGISNDRLSMIGRSFLTYATSAQIFHQCPTLLESLMCQYRNRLLSIQFLSAIAKKRDLGEILSGSGFYPNDAWMPPCVRIFPNVAEVAAKHCIHLGVYSDVLRRVKQMTLEELEKHVERRAPILLEEQLQPKPQPSRVSGRVVPKPPFVNFFSTYTHSEVFNSELVKGLCALVGGFFTQSGSKGALKLLEWLNFELADSDGDLHPVGSWGNANDVIPVTLEEATRLIPNLTNLEELIGYRFKNRKFLLEALTHPSYFANDISDCYQRLEFLGDGILDCLLTNYIFTKSSPHDFEKLTDIRNAIINPITYASLAVRYNLHKYMLSSSKPLMDMIDNFVVFQESVEHRAVGHFTLISDEECIGPQHVQVPKVLCDVFEALAGGIYVDSGYSIDAVWRVFYRLVQNELDEFFEDLTESPAKELKKAFSEPGKIVYQSFSSKKIHAKGREVYKIEVAHLGHYYGHGTTKERAKNAAAKLALKMCKEDDSILSKFDGSNILMMV